jgi:hypothetical protein
LQCCFVKEKLRYSFFKKQSSFRTYFISNRNMHKVLLGHSQTKVHVVKILCLALSFRGQIQVQLQFFSMYFNTFFKKYQNLPASNKRMITTTKIFKNRFQNEKQTKKYQILHFKKRITEKTVNSQNCINKILCVSLQSQDYNIISFPISILCFTYFWLEQVNSLHLVQTTILS